MQLAPSALYATAETLGGYLGWTPNELIIDGIVNLDGPRDRQIGMRLVGDGSSIQLWATGGAEPDAQEPTPDFVPLRRGHRWHTWIHIGSLEADRDPATVLYNAITDRLMPVFDTKPLFVGHRPWDPEPEPEADAEATAPDDTAATAEADTGQPAHPPAPAAQAEPQAEVVPMRTRRKSAAKTDTPAADDKPKPRPARKRTPAKPAAAKADDSAAEDKPKPRPVRKRTPAKKTADKPTTS
ncbi:hypothetical protein GCM10014715_39040 [Streptomyces spiralis]|uniref:Uncharacterized protein n=1 Tax=Streptomyces spiralis TaxID=66376 RepID=A0A919DTV7_9ACTN|nr:hypothetical protein [Streptomyces spiralis]GHE79904.1 hypothetical protein GCM10014715_39040 [Streptomyces spiralis]